jgi:hypothetical protein
MLNIYICGNEKNSDFTNVEVYGMYNYRRSLRLDQSSRNTFSLH